MNNINRTNRHATNIHRFTLHTSENANNLNTNYDIAELVGQIKKLNGDSPFMISLTDHNTINKSAYLKAQNPGP